MKNLALVVGVLLSFSSSTAVMAEDSFPGRAKFPEISIYSKSQLAKDYTNVVIVDARSAAEFDKLHITGAINIPVSNDKFTRRVNALRKQTTRSIVFYSNGQNCYNAYKAARASLLAGVKDVFAYDAGVKEWAKAYPQQVILPKKVLAIPRDLQLAQQL